jgi:5-carboxymethyl-2-hydroxymuconate isomerase
MPHVEIKYSDNQEIKTEKIFDDIERIINTHDASAGECKSRAYPCSEYKYTHILITISLLTKAHRDEKFTLSLSKELEASIKKHLTKSVYFSINIEYNDSYYTTNMHLIDGDILAGISP